MLSGITFIIPAKEKSADWCFNFLLSAFVFLINIVASHTCTATTLFNTLNSPLTNQLSKTKV